MHRVLNQKIWPRKSTGYVVPLLNEPKQPDIMVDIEKTPQKPGNCDTLALPSVRVFLKDQRWRAWFLVGGAGATNTEVDTEQRGNHGHEDTCGRGQSTVRVF